MLHLTSRVYLRLANRPSAEPCWFQGRLLFVLIGWLCESWWFQQWFWQCLCWRHCILLMSWLNGCKRYIHHFLPSLYPKQDRVNTHLGWTSFSWATFHWLQACGPNLCDLIGKGHISWGGRWCHQKLFVGVLDIGYDGHFLAISTTFEEKFGWIWCKPLRKVSYKHTFGTPNHGQMLDVWDDIQQMSTLRWRWHSYMEK